MALYEHVMMLRPDLSQAQAESLVDGFKGVIENYKGKVQRVEYWGLRSLAYRVKKNRKAHYFQMNIDAGHDALTEVERQERISEDVLRFLTLKVEAFDPEPSEMTQKRDREDRRPARRPRDGGHNQDADSSNDRN